MDRKAKEEMDQVDRSWKTREANLGEAHSNSTRGESEEIIPSPEMESSHSSPLMSPYIIHKDVLRTTLGINRWGSGKGSVEVLILRC